jgi:hypothetical protein
MKIFATDKKTGEVEEIKDLFWFEERGVHDFGGESLHFEYTFEFVIEMNDKINEIHPANDFWYTLRD